MSIILHRQSSSYSLSSNCSDALSHTSANKDIGLSPVRRISGSREATDRPFCDSGAASGDRRNNTIVNKLLKQPPAMGRMIPLKLQPSEEKRSQSTSYPLTATPSISTASPTSPRKARPRPVTDLIIIPYTHEEWRIVMEEVKILYLKGQYKHCSMRCKQILDSIKDRYQSHPLYSIYLCFFTASSLEMTARSLHNHSSNKLPLFQEALSFYKKAESFMEHASFAADPNLIHATQRSTHYHSSTSISSSIRSSVDSVFSQDSTTSTSPSGADSPTDADHPPPVPNKSPLSVSTNSSILRMKKKVSFSTKLSTTPSESDLRSETTLMEAFPQPPSAQEETALPPPEREHIQGQDLCTLSSYLLAQSIMRYRAQLTALSHQLSYHITSIHSQIATLSETRRARRSNFPNLIFEWERETGGAMKGVSREELVKVQLQERIRRLKERGWKRERFDRQRDRLFL